MTQLTTTGSLVPLLKGRKLWMVHSSKIIRLEARSNYTYVFCTDHPPVLMARVLRQYDEMLRPFGFIRTHRTHLINLEYVEKMDTAGVIHMKDTSCAEVSRRKRQAVIKRFLNTSIS